MTTSRKHALATIDNLLGVSTTLAILAVLAIWLDAAIVEAIDGHLTPALDEFFDDVSGVADASVFAIIALSTYGASRVAIALPVTQRWRPLCERARRGSLLMLLTLLTGGLITLALKHVVARARPSMLLEHGHYGVSTPFIGSPFNSFPSSHALTAFAVACVLAHLLPAWRAPLLVLATIASLCRVLTLEHFPSDVLASAFIAAWCVRLWAPRVQGTEFRN
jgi:membrane-associated phospholipid phosphatase